MKRKLLYVITALLVLSLLFHLKLGIVNANHDHELAWMNPYNDENGTSCCGEYD